MPENIPSDNSQAQLEKLLSQNANILDNIGDVLFQQGNFFEALGYYHQALIDRHNRDDVSEITTINNIIKTTTALLNSKNSSSHRSLSGRKMPKSETIEIQDDNSSDTREKK